MSFHDFRIVVTHCGGTNHHVSVTHVFGVMAFGKFNSHLLQPVRDVGFLCVGTGHTESQIDQHLGDTRHADAANANKMDVLNSSKHIDQWAVGRRQ